MKMFRGPGGDYYDDTNFKPSEFDKEILTGNPFNSQIIYKDEFMWEGAAPSFHLETKMHSSKREKHADGGAVGDPEDETEEMSTKSIPQDMFANAMKTGGRVELRYYPKCKSKKG